MARELLIKCLVVREVYKLHNDRIKIVLIDKQQLFREAIQQIMQTERDFHILTSNGDFLKLTDHVELHSIDLLLIEVNIFKNHLEDMKRLIKQNYSKLKVVILATLNDENIVKEALRLGIRGYLLKEMDISSFRQAIRLISEGVIYIHPMVNEVIVNDYLKQGIVNQERKQRPIKPPLHLLTKREIEVIQLLAQGKSNLEIAKALKISEKTVKNHISSIFKKIKVNDRTKAVVLAIRN